MMGIIDDFPDPPPPKSDTPQDPPAPLYVCYPSPADKGTACDNCGYAFGPGHKTIHQRKGAFKG